MPALIAALVPILDRVLGAVLPDPAARERALRETLAQLAAADLKQMEVNAEEAKSASLFVAGWRPAIGWCCAAALGYQYLLVPLGTWIAAWNGISVPQPPSLDSGLWELMAGMLGLGALRTVEKIRRA